ncbi:MAG: YihY/virulence factor BrkB family protein [Chloroflexi bacterium]|nr:YihY/virulence factor BrkB family protein [Chloroflexota bacterium]
MLLKLRNQPELAWTILKDTFDSYNEHRCGLWAAALAYYGLFSIFPLLLFLIFLGSQLLATGGYNAFLNRLLAESLPIEVANLRSIMDQALESRGSIGLIGAVGLLWSATAVFTVLESALNRIWGSDSRPFWGRRLLASAPILILSVAFLATLALGPVISLLLEAAPLPGVERLSGLAGFAIIVLTAYLLYRVFPNRSVPALPALGGALFASLLLVLARSIIDIYLHSAFTNYGAVYGSLSWILYLALWTFVVGTLFLLGGEFGAALERSPLFKRRKDSA